MHYVGIYLSKIVNDYGGRRFVLLFYRSLCILGKLSESFSIGAVGAILVKIFI